MARKRAEPKVKTCPICKKEFETNYGNQLYCSNKCHRAKIREENRAYWRKVNPGRRVSQIDAKAAAARAAGLSYGKYVARNM